MTSCWKNSGSRPKGPTAILSDSNRSAKSPDGQRSWRGAFPGNSWRANRPQAPQSPANLLLNRDGGRTSNVPQKYESPSKFESCFRYPWCIDWSCASNRQAEQRHGTLVFGLYLSYPGSNRTPVPGFSREVEDHSLFSSVASATGTPSIPVF